MKLRATKYGRCDWCDRPAVRLGVFPLGSGKIRGCRRHTDTAWRASQNFVPSSKGNLGEELEREMRGAA